MDRSTDSMRLLEVIRENAVDPAYRNASQKRHSPWLILPVLILAGLMFTTNAQQSRGKDSAITAERESLITRIEAAQARQNELSESIKMLNQEVRELGNVRVPESLSNQIDDLAPKVSAAKVVGPGIVVVVDDAPHKDGAHVTDRDLRKLVNGLNQAGAEAIAINGKRLSARTAIRNAGASITVDYTSLARPYRVEVIGDPKTLPARFGITAGAMWWNDLKQNYGIVYELSPVSDLELSADPGLGIRLAQPKP